jgi:hypothetical protein
MAAYPAIRVGASNQKGIDYYNSTPTPFSAQACAPSSRSSTGISRKPSKGATVGDRRITGKIPAESALWSAPLPPHNLENVGASELRAISIELRSAKVVSVH